MFLSCLQRNIFFLSSSADVGKYGKGNCRPPPPPPPEIAVVCFFFFGFRYSQTDSNSQGGGEYGLACLYAVCYVLGLRAWDVRATAENGRKWGGGDIEEMNLLQEDCGKIPTVLWGREYLQLLSSLRKTYLWNFKFRRHAFLPEKEDRIPLFHRRSFELNDSLFLFLLSLEEFDGPCVISKERGWVRLFAPSLHSCVMWGCSRDTPNNATSSVSLTNSHLSGKIQFELWLLTPADEAMVEVQRWGNSRAPPIFLELTLSPVFNFFAPGKRAVA